MNAREAMEALLEGKILTAYGTVDYRLNDTGIIEHRGHTAPAWHEYPTFMNNNPKIVEEYPLTFKEAVQAMLDGKICVSSYYPKSWIRFGDIGFEFRNPPCDKWRKGYLQYVEQDSKWKVVEE